MKPRIASWYESRLGRNDGNPLYITNVLKRDYADRVEFHHIIPDPTLQFEALGRFDLNLWVDWGEDALRGVLPYEPCVPPTPSLYWASDTHLGYDYRAAWAQHFTHVCTGQRGGLPGATWLPHAVEPQAYNPAAQYAPTTAAALAYGQVQRLKRWDVVFVGHINDETRLDLLDRVFAAYPDTAWWGSMRHGRTFERAADIYTQGRVVLNHAIKGDVNMRVFEALATRSFLLTPGVPGLLDLFEDGVHLVTYRDGDVQDALDKLARYLPDDDARERIAEAGYREVMAKHTFAHRVTRMLDITGVLG